MMLRTKPKEPAGIWRTVLALGILSGCPVLAQETDNLQWRWGGDMRLRQEAFDHIPVKTAEPMVSRGGKNDYFRLRTRLSGGVDWKDAVSLDARLANEFRVWNSGIKSYEWPDELIVDQLKLTVWGLWAGIADLTVGRQDVRLGSGRLFYEGTAKDGSRTLFFDGVRLQIRPGDKRTLDLFAFHGNSENHLAMGHEHRDLTGLAKGNTGMDETSAGFFWEDRSWATLGWGLYGIWLRDGVWTSAQGERHGKEDIHSLGARLMPDFGSGFSAEVELAGQFSCGSPSRRAAFAAGAAKWSPNKGNYLSLNGLALTGDDPATSRCEDFNPVYGRGVWISDLLWYAFDADGVGLWHNLSRTWLEAGTSFGQGHRLKASVGPVWAFERDGAGGGLFRGWLGGFCWDFPLAKGSGGVLTGRLQAELFDPGDYYLSPDTAWLARWQLNWEF